MANHRESKSTKEEVSANLSWAKCGNNFLVAEAHAQHVSCIRVQPRRCCRDGSELGNCIKSKERVHGNCVDEQRDVESNCV